MTTHSDRLAATGRPSGLPLDDLPGPPRSAPHGLLAGTRVLDLSTSIAGPYATMLLADMGADVVKLERPGGDDARAWGPPFLGTESLWFLSVNRGKRSLVLDCAAAQGRVVLDDLIARADVLVMNQVPRVQTKLKLDWPRLAAINPRLIAVSLTGFGLAGARRDLPCYDLIAEGYSGVMDLTGEAIAPPQKVGTPAADLIAGMDAAFAAVCALLDRQRTGAGHLVDVAMIDSMTRFMAPRLVSYLGSGELPRRTGARDSVIAIYQAFETADEPMTLGLGNDAIWRRFWIAVGAPEAAAEHASNADRRADRTAIVARIAAVLRQRPRAEWLRVLAEAGVPAGPINRLDEVAADPHLRDRGLLYAIQDGERRIPQVGLGIQIDGASAGPGAAPPRLGADAAAVLADWLGWVPQQIADLQELGIIGENPVQSREEETA